MLSEKIWTAEELDRLREAERGEMFRSSIVWDLQNVPPRLRGAVDRRSPKRKPEPRSARPAEPSREPAGLLADLAGPSPGKD